MQSESGEEQIHVLILGALLKPYQKGKMHKEDLCYNFESLYLSPNCKNLHARVYVEVVDGIGRKQIDPLSENLVVKKSLEKLCSEEATLKNLFFS